MDPVFLNILYTIQCFMYLIMQEKRKKLQCDLEKSIILKRQKRRMLILIQLLKKKKKRSCWVQPELLLTNHGNFWEVTVPHYSDDRFYKKFRLSRTSFDDLCTSLSPFLKKQNTHFRKSIPVRKRVAVALTVLKGNTDFWTVADLFGIGKSTVGYLLMEFCYAVLEHFSHLIHFPKSEEEKQAIAAGFFEKWQFYDCFGALDGTHIPILPPADQPEEYYNYKSFYSINVLAAVDHKYRFIYIVNGSPGKCNDSGIFKRCQLFDLYDNIGNKTPKEKTKYHIISDAAFPLRTWLMKPFRISLDMPQIQKNFNYRLSSARMAIENAFGRLKGRFRILSRQPNIHLKNMRVIIKACMILHNYCENCKLEVPESWIEAAAEEENELCEGYAERNDEVAEEEVEEEEEIQEVECPTACLKRFQLAERLYNDNISVVQV